MSALEQIQSRTAKRKADIAAKAEESANQYDFFKVKKDGDGKFKDVMILQSGITRLLIRLGFRRYDVGEGFIIVRIQDNIIEHIFIHRLRKFIVSYFKGLDDDVLEEMGVEKAILVEKLFRTLGTVTTDEKFALLVEDDAADSSDLTIVADTKDTAYYFYKNGFVEVTAEKITLRPYKELPGYVWKDQIIQRDYKPLKWQEWETGMYFEFANNVSNNAKDEAGNRNNQQRFASFMTMTGYCLHRYFNTKLKMPVFLDARISEDPDGRSGKSLHCKAMRTLMNSDPENGKQCVIIDGKNFDPENRFKYEDLHVSTRLLIIDDVKRGLPITMFFNSIVDGFMRELKGEKFKTRVWCKVILTLNYTLAIRGGSAMDRVVEFEFADFYSNSKTPEMVHGCWFFRDWDEMEWHKFDCFMMNCISDYLRGGIVAPETINLEARKLRDETCEEFINFMEDLAIEHEKPYDKKELFQNFGDVKDGKATLSGYSWLKQKTFTNWLRWYAQYRPEFAGYKESRSSGKDFIRFFFNEPVSAENYGGATIFKPKASKCVPAQVAADVAPEAGKLPDEPPY